MRVKTVAETNWKNYLLKAEQFMITARDAYSKDNWNAVGLNAVHSAISANDAICVFFKKKRSISDKHGDAVFVLLDVLNNNEESKEFSKHFSWLVNRKNLIEYETRLFYEKEALESLKHAERFLDWVRTKIDN